MSMMGEHGSIPNVGDTVLTTGEYETAQKTVSKLIAGEVPAKDIAIVGIGVRTVEKVTGRLGFATAARSGAVNGVLFGLLFGAILLLTTPEAPLQMFAAILFIGVGLGMCLSLISFTIIRRRRDYASVTKLAADSYEVRVVPGSFAKARQVLGAGRPESPRPPVRSDEPPRYGERIVQNVVADVAVAPDAGAAGAEESAGESAPPAQ